MRPPSPPPARSARRQSLPPSRPRATSPPPKAAASPGPTPVSVSAAPARRRPRAPPAARCPGPAPARPPPARRWLPTPHRPCSPRPQSAPPRAESGPRRRPAGGGHGARHTAAPCRSSSKSTATTRNGSARERIPIALCKVADLEIKAPKGKDGSGLASLGSFEVTDSETVADYGGGTYEAARAATQWLHIQANAEQVSSDPYRVRFTAYVERPAPLAELAAAGPRAGKKRSTSSSRSMSPASPTSQRNEVTELQFSGGFTVENRAEVSFAPELEAAVEIKNFLVQVDRARRGQPHQRPVRAGTSPSPPPVPPASTPPAPWSASASSSRSSCSARCRSS